jgi:hypothetical protein
MDAIGLRPEPIAHDASNAQRRKDERFGKSVRRSIYSRKADPSMKNRSRRFAHQAACGDIEAEMSR